MKKILIVNNNLHIGGVQKALLNLLWEIYREYDITLLLFSRCGELLDRIPDSVRVITPRSPFRWWGLTRDDCADAGSRISRSFWAAFTRIAGRSISARAACLFQPTLRGYDAAISFLHSGPDRAFYGGCNEFVIRCVEAEKKITFLHCDYKAIKADCAANTRLYERFDVIAACSQGCRDAFLSILPQFREKTVVVPNCQNFRDIAALAEESPVFPDEGKLNIVTVARFGREKAIPRAVRAVAELEESERAQLRYDIIGAGAEYSQTADDIKTLGLGQTVFMHGELTNPYGYIRAADVLLIPSISEAAPLVIGEAAALGVPILTTETSSAREMVEHPGIGWVCGNSRDDIRRAIAELIGHPERISEKKKILREQKPDNSQARRRFMELID